MENEGVSGVYLLTVNGEGNGKFFILFFWGGGGGWGGGWCASGILKDHIQLILQPYTRLEAMENHLSTTLPLLSYLCLGKPLSLPSF